MLWAPSIYWVYASSEVSCCHVLVGLAKRVRARFLLASTSEVYGGECVYCIGC